MTVELALNEADLSLRKREIPDKFNNPEYKPLFEEAFNRYAQIIKGCEEEKTLTWVALNYWNPMRYQERIEFPTMFQPEERKRRSAGDPFWILHRKYLKCDYGERNF